MAKKKKGKYLPSTKDILTLTYMRTILELVEPQKRTPLMNRIYTLILTREKRLLETMPNIYCSAVDVAKIVWPKVKEEKESFDIHIEPVVCQLYFSKKKEMAKMGLLHFMFNELYDYYYRTSDCDLEVTCMELVDEIWSVTDKVLFDIKKERKRGVECLAPMTII